jgi:hypothetical protein
MQTPYPHILQSMGITIGRLSTVFAKGKAKEGKSEYVYEATEAGRARYGAFPNRGV